MTIFLCDDEPQIVSDMVNSVTTALPSATLRTFSSCKELLSHIETASCDILLLDIDMPELTGLQVAKELSLQKKKPLLVLHFFRYRRCINPRCHFLSSGNLKHLSLRNKQPKGAVLLERAPLRGIPRQYLPQSHPVLYDLCCTVRLCQLLSCTVPVAKR